MKKMLTLFAVLLCCNIPSLFAEIDNREELRCLQLIPALVCPIGVDFAIPNKFVALSPKVTPHPTDWIYWGPAEVLTQYFKNPSSLNQPIIRLKLSTNVAQSELNDKPNLKGSGLKLISSSQKEWGMYPLLEIEAKSRSNKIYTAWVGLNDCSGTTVMFNLVYPKHQPSNQDLAFWNTFLEKTTQLPEQNLYLALGQDLQPGFTIVTCTAAWNTAKIKAIAERRKQDDKLQVALIPISDNLEIECLETEECFKGGEWNAGKPLVKLHCQVIENVSENYTNHVSMVVSILEKSVDEFSFSKEDAEFSWMSE